MVIYTDVFLLTLIKNWLIATNFQGFSKLGNNFKVVNDVEGIEGYNTKATLRIVSYSTTIVRIWIDNKYDNAIILSITHTDPWKTLYSSNDISRIKDTITDLANTCQELENALENLYIIRDVHLKL